MPNEIRAFQISARAQSEALEAANAGDGFETIGPAQFPSFTPPSFAAKCDSATKIVSGSAGDRAMVMYNFRRLDKGETDEHPFGYIIVSGSAVVSGSFLEHGDWDGRTTKVDAAFASHISSSGIGGYFLAHPPHGLASGALSDLTGSNAAAFEKFRAALDTSPDK